MTQRSHALSAVLALLVGCASPCPAGTTREGDRCLSELPPLRDGGGIDAGGPVDGGGVDAGPIDGGGIDAGPRDGGGTDAGGEDASVDAATDLDAGPPPDTGPTGCGASEACLPPTPTDWEGPYTIGEGAVNAPPCPADWSTEVASLRRGLTAAPASCSCGCSVTGVTCRMYSTVTGSPFTPTTSCANPLRDNDCYEAQAETGCTTSPSTTVPPVQWDAAARACSGAAAGSSCASGACFPRAAGQRLCVVRDGDFACPAGFPDRSFYHRDASDNRGCSACGCSNSGASCRIEIEVCSVGFYDVTLTSDGAEHCLPDPGDGDGVTQISTNVISTGTCSTSGGAPVGAAQPTGPMTVCCVF